MRTEVAIVAQLLAIIDHDHTERLGMHQLVLSPNTFRNYFPGDISMVV